MSNIDILKAQLITLVEEINQANGNYKIKFNQQAKRLGNMSLSGANGRMYVNPLASGYDVSLSGRSIEQNAYITFKDIFGAEHYGYKQANSNTGINTQPFWRTDNFSLVKKAALAYSKT